MSSPAPAVCKVSDDSYHVWYVDGKPVSVYLNTRVIREIRTLMQEAPVTRNRQREIGGILIGRVATNSATISVETIEVVPCEHARGDSWILSKFDKANLIRCMRRIASRGRLVPVGWFRTHTRRGLYLDQHDYELCRDHFCDPTSVALLIRPEAECAPEAGFFFWEEGEMQRTTCWRTFAFEEPSQPGPVPPPAPQALQPVARKHFPIKKTLLWAPAAAGLAAGLLWQPEPFSHEPRYRAHAPAATERTSAERAPAPQSPADATPGLSALPVPVQMASAATNPPQVEVQTRNRIVDPAPVTLQKPRPRVAVRVAPPRPRKQFQLAASPRRPAAELHMEQAPILQASASRVDAEPLLRRVTQLPADLSAPDPRIDRGSSVRRVVSKIPGFGFLKRKR